MFTTNFFGRFSEERSCVIFRKLHTFNTFKSPSKKHESGTNHFLFSGARIVRWYEVSTFCPRLRFSRGKPFSLFFLSGFVPVPLGTRSPRSTPCDMRSFSPSALCALLLALVSAATAAPRDARDPVSATRASRPTESRLAPVSQPRPSDVSLDQAASGRALPAGGEQAPGSLEPISIPYRPSSTFHPAWLRGYGDPGPFAEGVTSKTISLSFAQEIEFGFNRVVVSFPFDESATAATTDAVYPVIAWGAGAHNGCAAVDNRETLAHLSSWGFIVLCPEIFPLPQEPVRIGPFQNPNTVCPYNTDTFRFQKQYPGDEFVLFESIRFALLGNAGSLSSGNDDFNGRIDTNAIGVAGYSLGGGRIIRGLSSLATGASTSGLQWFGQALQAAFDPRAPLVCVDVTCVASAVKAAVSLQGWMEGPGVGIDTPLLLMAADDDNVVDNWRDGADSVFGNAQGKRLLGVMRGGGHNLGPHYWWGMQVAFLRAELLNDQTARNAVWGSTNNPPFGQHPNLLFARRVYNQTAVETFDFQDQVDDVPACAVALIPGFAGLSC